MSVLARSSEPCIKQTNRNKSVLYRETKQNLNRAKLLSSRLQLCLFFFVFFKQHSEMKGKFSGCQTPHLLGWPTYGRRVCSRSPRGPSNSNPFATAESFAGGKTHQGGKKRCSSWAFPKKNVSSSEKDDNEFWSTRPCVEGFFVVWSNNFTKHGEVTCFERIRYKIGKPVIWSCWFVRCVLLRGIKMSGGRKMGH